MTVRWGTGRRAVFGSRRDGPYALLASDVRTDCPEGGALTLPATCRRVAFSPDGRMQLGRELLPPQNSLQHVATCLAPLSALPCALPEHALCASCIRRRRLRPFTPRFFSSASVRADLAPLRSNGDGRCRFYPHLASPLLLSLSRRLCAPRFARATSASCSSRKASLLAATSSSSTTWSNPVARSSSASACSPAPAPSRCLPLSPTASSRTNRGVASSRTARPRRASRAFGTFGSPTRAPTPSKAFGTSSPLRFSRSLRPSPQRFSSDLSALSPSPHFLTHQHPLLLARCGRAPRTVRLHSRGCAGAAPRTQRTSQPMKRRASRQRHHRAGAPGKRERRPATPNKSRHEPDGRSRRLPLCPFRPSRPAIRRCPPLPNFSPVLALCLLLARARPKSRRTRSTRWRTVWSLVACCRLAGVRESRGVSRCLWPPLSLRTPTARPLQRPRRKTAALWSARFRKSRVDTFKSALRRAGMRRSGMPRYEVEFGGSFGGSTGAADDWRERRPHLWLGPTPRRLASSLRTPARLC